MIPEFLQARLPGPVAVLGGGVSGAGTLELLARVGGKGVVFDEKLTASGVVNNFDAATAAGFPLVVFSPGFPPGHRWLAAARGAGCLSVAELDLAAAFWRGRVVAITGTNGKTTLTELLAHALRSAGRDARAAGNIGYSFARLAAETIDDGRAAAERIAVCEVSSFQAEALERFRADATLWTNLAEDHLERHPSMESYFAAKWNLVERTVPGAAFLGESAWRFAVNSGRSVAGVTRVFSEVKEADPRLAGTIFAQSPQRENFLLAEAWWRHAGLPGSDLVAAARTFRPGRHRLARVAEVNGVTWWNDSKATNFHAVEAALGSFPGPVLLIAGGKSKGGDIGGFVRRIAPRVRRAFLLGETAGLLAEACRAVSVAHEVCSSLAEAVRRAAAAAHPGDQVLLSPGFASFDLFRGYEDRGNQFEALVNNLGVKPSF